jgi:ubiquinone/menaquinone biosynthesis C-methylase UbiE
MSSEIARDYFELLADAGMTKHLGSMEATRELVDMCRIDDGKYVLDVGCGVGATPVYLAKDVGCRVMGVDLLDKMIEQSREWVKAEGLQDRVDFRVADARNLPFEDGCFDAVISESVNVFFNDKSQAMREYIRVTKPEGYIGMTEITWLKPPSPAVEDSIKGMVDTYPMDASGWKDLMEDESLVDVIGSAHRIDIVSEGKGRIERYRRRITIKRMLKMIGMLLSDRRMRQIMKGGVGAVSKDLVDVMGYVPPMRSLTTRQTRPQRAANSCAGLPGRSARSRYFHLRFIF